MAKQHVLDNLQKWFGHDRWAEHVDTTFYDFFGDLLADYDVDFERASELVGPAATAAMWGCHFEAAVTQPCEESDEGSILADYLKRRGWKESAATRRYLQALGDSIFSLHEVVEVIPGKSLVLKDRLLDGEPLLVTERAATAWLSAGDFLAARVVEIGGQYELTDGLFKMSNKAAESMIAFLHPALARMEDVMANMEDLEGTPPEEATALGKRMYLDANVATMVQVWLDEELSQHLKKLPPPSVNDDDEPLVFVRLSYPLLSPENAETLEDRLDKARFLLVGGGDADWYWLNEGDVSEEREGMSAEGYRKREKLLVELEDGTTSLGRLELSDDRLDIAVNSLQRAEKIQLLLAPIVAGLIGPVSIDQRTMDQLYEGLEDDLAAEETPADGLRRRAS